MRSTGLTSPTVRLLLFGFGVAFSKLPFCLCLCAKVLLNRDVDGAVEVDEEEGEVFRTSGIAGLQTHDGAVAARCSRAGGRGAMARCDGEGKSRSKSFAVFREFSIRTNVR